MSFSNRSRSTPAGERRGVPTPGIARMGRLIIGALALSILTAGMAPLPAAQDSLDEIVRRLRGSEESAQAKVELGNSALEQLEQEPDDAVEVEVRLAMGVALVALERLAEARDHLEICAELARKTGNDTALAHSLWELGVVAFHGGDFSAGIEWCREGADVAESIERLDILWRSANVLGLIQERSGDYAAALESFARGVEAAERSGDTVGTAVLLGNIGIAQMNLGEYGPALESFGRARDLQLEIGDESSLPSNIANLGDVHFLMEEYDKAYEFHMEALRLREKLGFEVELSLSYHSLGAIHYARDEYDLALKRFERSLEIRQRLGLAPEQAATLAAMSRVYAALGRDAEAIDSIKQALDLTDQLQMEGRRLGLLESLATVYEEQGAYAEAVEVLHEARKLEREQRSTETHRRYAEFEAKLDGKDKERRIALLTKESELQALALNKQRLVRNALLIGTVLLTVTALVGWFAWAILRKTHKALTLANEEVVRRGIELQTAVERIKRLEGLLPICGHCKSIRDEAGEWYSLEAYVTDHSEAKFSHGICPRCFVRHYPEAKAETEAPT